MLGKLFNLTSGGAGSASANQTSSTSRLSPESIQEEIHTWSLLFPDTQALYYRHDQVFPLPTATALPSSSPNTFDYDGELELDVRDVRVIIMQDSLGSVNPSLLFDSHPGPAVASGSDRPSPGATPTQTPAQTLVQDLRRNPTSPRKTSLSQSRPVVNQPDSPQPRQGAFDRRSSFQSRNHTYVETETQRASREYREELASFSSCIFANTEVMSYKGTSTKVHIVPSEPRSSDVASSYVGDSRGSMGRTSMRTSRLAQSFTSESATAASNNPGRPVERKKVLVTRLFPVNLPNDDLDTPNTSATVHSRMSEDGGGFPFPCSPDESTLKKKKHQPKQKRTPMYAVALVLQLPAHQISSAAGASKQAFRGPSSYTDPETSFSSSFNSARRSGWSMVGSGYGAEAFDSIYSNDVEDRMDAITQHWDIIMRTLTHLQSVVATALFPMLKQADYAAPDPQPPPVSAQIARASSITSRRGSNASQMKPPKTNAKLVTLGPHCLMQDQQIGREVGAARVRIVSGLRATRVVTGQGRWGPWRDEARWVAKWAGGKEQGFFFFNLLTGFLATHTDWLQALSPVWYRRRHYQQQKAKSEEDTSLPSRTIVVAKDKMAARRLVFLLSAFLPANQQLPTVRTQRPSTSASFSHSPPSYIVPILKEESLRRKINRRPTGPRGASHNRSFSIQSQATTSMETHHARQSSDAPSTFKPANLPIPGSDLSTRKSSAATTNTITPDAAIPHFSVVHQNNLRRGHRPGSSGSIAADDLKRTLRRGESTGHISIASTDSRSRSSNWGSMISGLWSTRRRDSTATSSRTMDFPQSQESPLASPSHPTGRKDRRPEMVSEAQVIETPARDEFGAGDSLPPATADLPDTLRTLEGRSQAQLIGSSRIPDPSGAFESPVKTSINTDDGVIDVDVQFPEYLTSFESAISSPSSSGYLSTPGMGMGLDSFEQFSRVAIEGEAPLNVAGWLQQYHPDFALQAIPPQANLLDEIKESLKAEPTPSTHALSAPVEWPVERWVDVSSAIVADATNFTIKRYRYRRLVKPKLAADRSSTHNLTSSTNPYSSSLMTPALSPYEHPIKEKIEEETLVTLDEVLIDAVEKGSSTNSSRGVSEPDKLDVATASPNIREVPRAECKTVVLSALGGIVQDVVDQREKQGQTQPTGITYEAIERESALRGAIRNWLETVELGDG
ncbi:folliculin-interacting protein N-terminus-domain-containing protein [Pseudomassariella vexata]|uniref:Folliculin-interacting protein N-terminus-domain-containing protein n=1 Tax=Pseudomassariella vexata TaxID=1141098 RepID=A0A1Y2E199_9PEZI|nr:folliculin-interacting protein N-terminus-domain-containing protein [Pseudomassariella vexata]ORY65114.1 folliculin-interacting protein N-terminus-domain-containing protein [Pseudomassariella vexata]